MGARLNPALGGDFAFENPVESLWQYAFQIASIRSARGMPPVTSAPQECETVGVHIDLDLQNLDAAEDEALEMLALREEAQIDDEAIVHFLRSKLKPSEVMQTPKESALAKTKQPRTVNLNKNGIPILKPGPGLSHSFLLMAGELEPKHHEHTGRVSTGRNLKALNAGHLKIPGEGAEEAFIRATADTHGGKVRKTDKGTTYRSGGRAFRKI